MVMPDSPSVPPSPEPSFTKTYKLVDPSAMIADEYGWVTSLDYFDNDDVPVELIEETWERTGVRSFWHLPELIYSCEVELDCDEDATAWVMANEGPMTACAEHAKLHPAMPEESDG